MRKNKLIKSLRKKEPSNKPTKSVVKEFIELINKEETGINSELFKKHFRFQIPSAMLHDLYIANSESRDDNLVNLIKSGLSHLKQEIEHISEDEIKIERPGKIADIVEKILDFKKQNQEGQRLKILHQIKCLVDYQLL